MPVSHEHRATAAVVRDYLSICIFEGRYVLSRKCARALEVTSVSMQGAAAHLTRGRLHRAAIHFEHTCRGLVDSLEKSISDTSFKEKHRSGGRSARIHRSARILRAVHRHPACLPALAPPLYRIHSRPLKQGQPKFKLWRDFMRKFRLKQ